LELIELKTNTRTTTGKGSSRALRREKRIPAILYGSKTEPILLSLEQALLEKVFKTSSTHALIHLIIDDDASNKKTVMIKELQTHPVSRTFLHLDFYEIDMTKKVHVNVPVVTTGKSAGVEFGGIIQIVRRELEILCLPSNIPAAIEIDISMLGIGDSIHVDEISLPEGVEIPENVNFTMITVLTPKVEEEPAEEEEEEEIGAEEEEAETKAETKDETE
jgi:large subunit ribosomal protein L25